ncbi:MAG TPA: hypothetical protein VGK54_08160, partial [Chloroflexota bacterium]
VDDTHTMDFGFAYRRIEGARPGRYQFTGTSGADRPYEERQRQPGDYEALPSQREIAVHALEHLGWSDGGVSTVRKLVREGIRAVERGEDPPGVVLAARGVIDTYAHSSVLKVPAANTPEQDKELLRETGRKVLNGWHSDRAAVLNGPR